MKVDPEYQVKVVEEWSKEHPVKTRMSEFLKQYPNAKIKDDGLPQACPCDLEKNCKCDGVCNSCREKYWSEEIE